MAKIIKLNENDLKRIVTKVLNERRLNEEDKVTNSLSPGRYYYDVIITSSDSKKVKIVEGMALVTSSPSS